MSEFARIFCPKTERAVKAILLLTNGAKYKPTEEEVAETLDVLKSAVNDIAQLYGILPGGEVVVKDVPQDDESIVEAKKDHIKRSPFAHEDINANVHSIPEAQLTNYATHIMARLCEKFETMD